MKVLAPLSCCLREAFAQWEKPLADGLRIMVRNGELGRADRPDRISAATIGALQGGMLLARVWMDVQPLRDTVTMAVNDIRRRINRAADKKQTTATQRPPEACDPSMIEGPPDARSLRR
jgi:hypothetical protein